jgi:hypothetical protein
MVRMAMRDNVVPLYHTTLFTHEPPGGHFPMISYPACSREEYPLIARVPNVQPVLLRELTIWRLPDESPNVLIDRRRSRFGAGNLR